MTLHTYIELLHYGLLLIFGTFVSAAFSGIFLNKKNIFILSGISTILIVIQIYFYTGFGYDFTTKIYPFISHLPLVLFLTFGYKRSIFSAIYSVTTTYLCCQISKWLGLLTFAIIPRPLFYNSARCILLIVIGILLIRYMSPLMSEIVSKNQKTVLIFCILPFVYYLFDYATVIYTNWLYTGNPVVYEFLPFILSIVYLIFCTMYFHEYELSLLRHDMRHHLQNIMSYIENGNAEHAISYIEETIGAVDTTSVHRFCKNELVNTVLSFYQGVMEKHDIFFDAAVNIHSSLPCSELDFTAILSNGLENAVKAVSTLPIEQRTITLSLKTEQEKLLLSINNRYGDAPVIVDGKPLAKKNNHGFGTESIRYVTKKLNGNCQFFVKDEFFILRVIL